jgi:hypothetical protein
MNSSNLSVCPPHLRPLRAPRPSPSHAFKNLHLLAAEYWSYRRQTTSGPPTNMTSTSTIISYQYRICAPSQTRKHTHTRTNTHTRTHTHTHTHTHTNTHTHTFIHSHTHTHRQPPPPPPPHIHTHTHTQKETQLRTSCKQTQHRQTRLHALTGALQLVLY